MKLVNEDDNNYNNGNIIEDTKMIVNKCDLFVMVITTNRCYE